ncbi:MAG: hypothetical protein KC561_13960, partial [Myxococcales bacterium]|nr:hypothetical protein [Myxococcales bacterium]
GDYTSFEGTVANELTARGVAVLGIDQPLHGTRNPTENEDDFDLIVRLAVSNIVIGRDMLRQHIVDLCHATRMLRAGITIPASVTATGVEIHTSPDRLAFMGHSQGAQVGALFLGVEPDIHTGMLSEVAGGSAIALLERKEDDIDIEAVVGTALGLAGSNETLVEYHPAIGAVVQQMLGPADPLEYARGVFLDPPGETAHSVLMTEGTLDTQTPPRGIEALATAMGLPVALPIVSEIDTMALVGIPSVSLPVTQNLPSRDVARSTGALLQFSGRNHFLVFRDPGAQYQVFEFLRTALDGQAVIYPAEDK